MHEAAFRWVQKMAAMLPPRRAVCELGSRNVNGSVRSLFASASSYVGIDTQPGPGVDIVADASHWRPEDKSLFDTVISTESLEHAPRGDLICQTALKILESRGIHHNSRRNHEDASLRCGRERTSSRGMVCQHHRTRSASVVIFIQSESD
jgi:hypothetical protein